MKETNSTHNSNHADPDHPVVADRVVAECGGCLHGWHCPGIQVEYVAWLSITS